MGGVKLWFQELFEFAEHFANEVQTVKRTFLVMSPQRRPHLAMTLRARATFLPPRETGGWRGHNRRHYLEFSESLAVYYVKLNRLYCAGSLKRFRQDRMRIKVPYNRLLKKRRIGKPKAHWMGQRQSSRIRCREQTDGP
ncbi:unnamed protein product [Nezara viridula]|uniref:Uncharacterized protein n=1 Tax=Nezara viridula TaxID=85310 RepID=A0A9P0H9D9_NEZVI|nr:unnamed protein product [Nezara viridula]